MTEIWMARGKMDGLGYGEIRIMPPDEAKFLVKWGGVIAAFFKMSTSGAGSARKTTEEYVAYLTLNDVRKLLKEMEPFAGPSDEPLPPPITGPEWESFKIVEGPNV